MSFMGAKTGQILTFLVKQSLKRNTTRCISFTVSNRVVRELRRTRCIVGSLSERDPIKIWQINRRTYADLPSHIKVTLPALSPTMETGTIANWAKKEGDKLNEGDLLAEIETDKATMGFETPEEGYLAKMLIPSGTKDVPVGKLVCIIVQNQSDVAAFKNFKDDGAPAAAAAKPAAPAAAAPAAAAPPAAAKGRIYASPMAKRLAEIKGLRLEGVKGSGVYGSVKSADLPAAGAAPAAKPAAGAPAAKGAVFTDIPLTAMRSVIAKRLLESKQNIPHYYISVDCCVDDIMKIRKEINKTYEKEKVRVSVNDFVIKAVATACHKVPEANSSWMDTFIRQYNAVDVSVAVSTDKGLLTPIVFDADRKGLIQISNDVKTLAKKAREGKLQPQEFQGGTISVSNLGMFGTNNFCAIINPPQAAILAIGTSVERMVPVNGVGVPKTYMTVTLSADHRILDGAAAANWLTAFRKCIEQPYHMYLW